MKISVRRNAIFLPLLAVFSIFVPISDGFAQSEKITLDMQLSPQLENAQVINISSLGLNKKGVGPVILSGTMTNNTNRKLENLFFEFTLEAGRAGTLAKLTQQAAYPFTLDPFQVVYATNNDVEVEIIPGIEETMKFEGGLTPEGEEFIESLEGVSKLPSDLYTINLTIYQFTNADGRTVLASQTLEVGSGGGQSIVSDQSIFLKTPGDEVGSEVIITNQYPQFSWEGDAVNEYRVIVVRARGNQSPESLIQNARSSEPTNNGGDLLQFENLDLIVQGNTFQFPSSGVQALIFNQTYYWQVTTEVQTGTGTETVNSGIWAFKLGNPGKNLTGVTLDEETTEVLYALLGEDIFAELTEEGFSLEGFSYDGKDYTGMAAVQQLNRILRKIQDGDIIVDN